MIMKVNSKDDILNTKREESITAVSFLKALKRNLNDDTAFKIALEAFTIYMTSLYENVLKLTKKGSQERFDCFRAFYENYSKKTPYLTVFESSSIILKVQYNRCPFYEILEKEDLKDIALSFCMSDPAFTEIVLPGFKFSRKQIIAKGDSYCDHTWKFKLP